MPNARVLLSGLAFPESPRWHDGRLYVSDWGANEVIAVAPDGASEVVARVPSFPMCIDFLPDGRLLVVSSQGPSLVVQGADGTLSTYAGLAGVSEKPFNDITVDRRGNVFVNNVGFDFPGGEPVPGLVALVTPDGQANEVAGGVMFPNGMAVTKDDSTLIVAESYAGKLTAFEIAADGSLSAGRAWAELDGGVPDGICLDDEGAVWYADVPNQCCVRVAEGGKVLQRVELDRGAFSCAVGEGTLYVATNSWGGTGAMDSDARNGQMVAVEL